MGKRKENGNMQAGDRENVHQSGALQQGVDSAPQLFPGAQEHSQHDVAAFPWHNRVDPRLGPVEKVIPQPVKGVPEGRSLFPQVVSSEGHQIGSHPHLGKGQLFAQFCRKDNLFPTVKGQLPVRVKEDIPCPHLALGYNFGVPEKKTAAAALPSDHFRDGAGDFRLFPRESLAGLQKVCAFVPA